MAAPVLPHEVAQIILAYADDRQLLNDENRRLARELEIVYRDLAYERALNRDFREQNWTYFSELSASREVLHWAKHAIGQVLVLLYERGLRSCCVIGHRYIHDAREFFRFLHRMEQETYSVSRNSLHRAYVWRFPPFLTTFVGNPRHTLPYSTATYQQVVEMMRDTDRIFDYFNSMPNVSDVPDVPN